MAVAILALAVLALVAGAVAFFLWATSSYDPPRTVASAAALLRRPLRLQSALDTEWREPLAIAQRGGTWERLLAPPIPPAICLPSDAEPAALNDAVRALDATLRRPQGAADIGRRIDELRAAGPLPESGDAEVVLRYNLGRAHLAAGDFASAAEITEPLFERMLARDRLPVTSAAMAPRLIRDESTSAATAATGFHARFLAGAIAYRRGEMAEAIKHFRLAINAVNYIATADSVAVEPATHYTRVVVPAPGDCADQDEWLTSLDAYAALVAAYMAAPDFTDPSRLPPEVRRTRLQIDPDDPFRPVLNHARAVAHRPSASPIPENLLWAASNLQRVYHYNRLRPDPRLAVTRAALLLHLTSNQGWIEAMAGSGDTDVCRMLTAVATQLEHDAAARTIARTPSHPADSAQAAVAVHTFSRIQTDCGRDHLPAVATDVRSAWLQNGRALGAGLPGLYEEWRLTLERALQSAGGAEDATARAVAPVLARMHEHAAAFTASRVPTDLSAAIDPDAGRRFVAAWRRAIFEDIANALADAASASVSPAVRTVSYSTAGVGGPHTVEIPAGRAQHFLATLNSAIAHAGLRPSQVYAPAELQRLAGSGGRRALLEYRIQYFARSNRGAMLLVLTAFFGVAVLGLLAVHVTWWRYRLLVGDRFYAAEARKRAARDNRA
jgi:hypothetical protein